MTRAYRRRPIAERFWEKVDRSGGSDACWAWTACVSRRGYGQFGVERGRIVYAHRFAFELLVGPVPDGLFVCHQCDNRVCVNPRHLFLGTAQENTTDAKEKGRLKPPPKLNGSRNHAAKLSPEAVVEIRRSSARTEVLAEHFGVSTTAIGDVRSGKTWRHLDGGAA